VKEDMLEGADICSRCDAVAPYGTMEAISEESFDLLCDKCRKKDAKKKTPKAPKRSALKTIRPEDVRREKPAIVIDFVPMIKRDVGIGFVVEGEAEAYDFEKYPVVARPWINLKEFENERN